MEEIVYEPEVVSSKKSYLKICLYSGVCCICSFVIVPILIILVALAMGSKSSALPQDQLNATSWPVQDELGYYQSYKHNNRWCNWWRRERFSDLKFMFKFITAPNLSNVPSSEEELKKNLPVSRPYWLRNDTATVGAPGIRATWIGHATVLAEVDETVIITDPIFSERASAVQFAGPKRFRPPACTVEELPKNLKAVVISHTHYDHLDYNSVHDLNKRYGSELHWFVPMDMGAWFTDNFSISKDSIHELKWWDEEKVPGTDTVIALTPNNHWGKRSATDDNKALWGSWSIIGPTNKFWFGGDTGYCDVFKQIGKKYGPFDLSAIPIGAYEPREIMCFDHVNPEEAYTIHEDLQSKTSFGIHWATFTLTNEPYMEPKERMEKIVKDKNVNDFKVIPHGESIEG